VFVYYSSKDSAEYEFRPACVKVAIGVPNRVMEVVRPFGMAETSVKRLQFHPAIVFTGACPSNMMVLPVTYHGP
jgi:hypothetical protein